MMTVDVPAEMIVGLDAETPPRLKMRIVLLAMGIPIAVVAAPPNGQKNTVSVDAAELVIVSVSLGNPPTVGYAGDAVTLLTVTVERAADTVLTPSVP